MIDGRPDACQFLKSNVVVVLGGTVCSVWLLWFLIVAATSDGDSDRVVWFLITTAWAPGLFVVGYPLFKCWWHFCERRTQFAIDLEQMAPKQPGAKDLERGPIAPEAGAPPGWVW
jgi:hypothetical protein